MNKVNRLAQTAKFALYVALQIIIARPIVLFNTTACFVYVGFLLSLPQRQTNPYLLVLGFMVGLLIDMFYNSLGIHAFASVLLIYSKSLLIRYIFPSGSQEPASGPTLLNLGLKKFSMFALTLILIHHTALFFLEAWGNGLLALGLRKAASSTLLTYVAILLIQSFPLIIAKR